MKKEKAFRKYTKIPTLHTARLALRQMHPIDAEDMYEYACREDVTKYLLWSPHPSLPYTRDYLRCVSRRYAAGDFYDWAIIEQESRKMIGTCGFAKIDFENHSAEIGYVLNPDFHKNGYAHEAATRVMEFGFSELELHRIEARFMEGNEPSLRVMQKLGMTFEGYHKDALFIKGSYRTVGYAAITAEEFSANVR